MTIKERHILLALLQHEKDISRWKEKAAAAEDAGFDASPQLNFMELVANYVGVPPDLTTKVPFDMIPEVYCWDWLYEMADNATADEWLSEMERAARDGDTHTSPRAKAFIQQNGSATVEH